MCKSHCCIKLEVRICFVVPSSKFDAYTNYVVSDVKRNNFWQNLNV